MPKYLYVTSYTAEGARGLKSQGGSARRAAAEESTRSVGGSIESFYFAFGGRDCYIVVDLPDNGAAAALALAVNASGAMTTETVVLLTPEELDAAAGSSVAFRPPGS